MVEPTATYEAERARLLRIAGRLLRDPAEAEDVVQHVWLRLHGTDADIENLPGWLTTVTTRLCLDRLRAVVPEPVAKPEPDTSGPDPAEQVALADTVGTALTVVLDRLSPSERVAFVLHDSFSVDHATIAEILGVTPGTARKLASRARHKVAQPPAAGARPDWQLVDAFLAAARGGDLSRLLALLAPDVVVTADADAVALGTPAHLDGAEQVAGFFNGAATAAVPVLLDQRPGAAWFQRGQAKVVFDVQLRGGAVGGIVFRAAPDVLARVERRPDTTRDREPVTSPRSRASG